MNRSLLYAVLALGFLWLLPAGHALDEAPYAVARKPWPDGLGNHRAVVQVDANDGAAVARIPWRRRDREPERKDIFVLDAATGRRVTNTVRLASNRFQGLVLFEPVSGPGEYFVYYLPYPAQKGWDSYDGDYFPPHDTADPAWVKRVLSNPNRIPPAAVLRLEARTAFDSFFPMEIVATPEEKRELLDRGPAPYLLFPEDRRFPIRMTDDLPLKWAQSGPTNVFRGAAQRNEFYVFQIGVWAARTNLARLDVAFSGEIAPWLSCFNTGGTHWDGRPFRKTLNVPRDQVQALWFGVNVPADAQPGEHRATVTIRPTNAPPASVELMLAVLPTELADHGDGDAWRLSRLRWLNSTLGTGSGEPTPPYRPLELVRSNQTELIPRTVRGLGREIRFQTGNLPSAIQSNGHAVLAGPIRCRVDRGGGVVEGEFPDNLIEPAFQEADGTVVMGRSWRARIRNAWLSEQSVVDFDGHVGCQVTLNATESFSATNLLLEIPLRPEIASYFMGLGRRAGRTPTNFTWHWTGPFNSFWIGNAAAGLQVKLLGSTYEGPMQNLYHPEPPPTWFNDGQGGVTINRGTNGEVLVQVFTGPFELKAKETRTFEFSLLVTPVKPLDTATHFRERYWHSTHDIPDDVNVINVHHATAPNPFINYPFLALDTLREFCRTNQARGRKVKIYYTVRELTSRLPELWALRSLGDEVLAGGPGGGYPWLREHLGGNYTPAWFTEVEGNGVDAAILTSGASRWYNFYVEGLNWLVRNVPIDGLYLDDVAYDRTILKRMRHVMDAARPGCLIDLHSNTLFSQGPAVQYTEFFPYVDRLWFGEGFDYDAMSPVQWLVESSGIPFGLMGDMLQDGGNRWLGMVFGMTARAPWTAAADPGPVWRVWDDFGIADAKMLGWWDSQCPVRTGRNDVLATACVKPGKTLVAVASWAKEKTDVRLTIDWPALGLDASKARFVAPEVKDFQPEMNWRPDEAISVEPLRGWLIYVTE